MDGYAATGHERRGILPVVHAVALTAALLIACLVSGCSDGHPGAEPDAGPGVDAGPAPYQAEVHALAEPLVDDGWSVGIEIGLLLPDGTTATYSLGSTSEGGGAAPDAQTVFEIGSITKTFTALALASMVEEGSVTLDQPVQELLPSAEVTVPSFGGVPITLEHLATHTSALPRSPDNMAPADPSDPYADYHARELYAFLDGYTLTAEPGTRYEYSNVGFGLLGHALSLADGGTWDDLVATRVLQPLSMADTARVLSASQEARFAQGYDGDLNAVPPWTFDVLAGTGALRSTASDMLRYVSAQVRTDDATLAREIALTHMPRFETSGTARIGLAWNIADDRWVWKNGGTAGFGSFVGFDQMDGAGVVVLSNVENAWFTETALGLTLLKMLAGESYDPIDIPPPSTPTVAELEPYVGSFVDPTMPAAGALVISLDGPDPYVQIPDQPRFRIYVAATDRFYARRAPLTLMFDCTSGSCDSLALAVTGGASVALVRQ